MEMAALGLSVKSDSVVKGAADLDKFAASADKATAAAGKLSSSGSTAKMAADYARAASAAQQASGSINTLATSATRSGAAIAAADSHVVAYRNHLAAIPAAANQAAAGVNRFTTAANDNINQMQSNTANIAAQFQDIGVTAAMGMNPLMIALQQGTQLSAVMTQAVGTGGLAGGLRALGGAIGSVLSPMSLMTIAVVALIAYLVQLASEFLTGAEKADELAKSLDTSVFSTYALSDAQGILSNVFDMTTGKIINQSGALRDLAQAQLLVARAEATRRLGENRSYLGAFSRVKKGTAAGPIAGQALSGQLSARDSMQLLEAMHNGGKGALATQDYYDLLGRISGVGAEEANLKLYEKMQRSLDTGTLDPSLRTGGGASSRTRSGGKSDADRLAEIVRQAEAEITVEKNRAKAVEMSAEAAAHLEQKTKLLNAASQAGLKITPELTAVMDTLAETYAKAKTDADIEVATKAATDAIQSQRDAIAEAAPLIGLYGEALARANRELEAQKKLADSLPKDSIVASGGNLTGGLSDDIEAQSRAQRIADLNREREIQAFAMEREMGSLGLINEELLKYNYQTEQLLKLKRAGIEAGPAEIANINAAAEAYANQRYAVDQATEAMALQRETVGGFFRDFIQGTRNGANAIKAFADAAVNALNRVIEKLLDKAFDGLGGGGGGGIFGKLFSLFGGGSSLNSASQSLIASNPAIFAKGGVFGAAERFAKGGVFTNSVVTSPTLFRFAKGGALGEMGEAGPEAIMPLKRGPNGALGVQVMGGRGRMGSPNITVNNDYHLDGAISIEGIAAFIRQASAQTQDDIKRQLGSWMQEYDRDGAVAV